jgi:hypothetical protein
VIDDLILQPLGGVADPMGDYFGSYAGISGAHPRPMPIVEEGTWISLDLNQWFRFDRLGDYHLYLTGHPKRSRFAIAEPDEAAAETLNSNTVDFEIVPATPSPAAQELSKALEKTDFLSHYNEHGEGCRMLRFLGTQDAARVMIQHYSDDSWRCQYEFTLGLFGSPHREFIVREMEKRLHAPEQPVTGDYLRALAVLSIYLQRPDLTSSEVKKGRMKSAFGGPLMEHAGLIRVEQAKYPSVTPGMLERLREDMAAAFLDLPGLEQDRMLRRFWNWKRIAGPAMLPVLRKIYENSTSNRIPPSSGITLQRIYELSPEEGRRLILEQIQSPHPRVEIQSLRILPDETLPEVEGILADNLLECANEDDLTTILNLVERYATPAVAPRISAAVGDRLGELPCGAELSLLAYFQRADPIIGNQVLDRALAARERTKCHSSTLSVLAERQMSPHLEEVALKHLDDPYMVSGAVGMLGRFGSAGAEQPLWRRYEKWHQNWRGRENELPDMVGGDEPNTSQVALEVALVRALGMGRGWFAGPEKLERLKELCVSRYARRRAEGLIEQHTVNRSLSVSWWGEDNFSTRIAQYELRSVEALKEKLAQFPPGRTFVWSCSGPVADKCAELYTDLKALLEQRSMSFEN